MITFITGENNLSLCQYAKKILSLSHHQELKFDCVFKLSNQKMILVENKHRIGIKNIDTSKFCLVFPETEQSPRKQSMIGEWIIDTHNNNKVKIEDLVVISHSDHIFNYLRYAVKSNQITSDEITVVFIKESEVINIKIDSKGKLWRITEQGLVATIPKGFFDEWTNAMFKLL